LALIYNAYAIHASKVINNDLLEAGTTLDTCSRFRAHHSRTLSSDAKGYDLRNALAMSIETRTCAWSFRRHRPFLSVASRALIAFCRLERSVVFIGHG